MDNQDKNRRPANSKTYSWKKYFSGWNFVVNGLIACVPATYIIFGLSDILGINGVLVTIGVWWGLIYIVGRSIEKLKEGWGKMRIILISIVLGGRW